eukprot:scaffold59003_cov18-Prasinocladus_malaysianus.AAC.1
MAQENSGHATQKLQRERFMKGSSDSSNLNGTAITSRCYGVKCIGLSSLSWTFLECEAKIVLVAIPVKFYMKKPPQR